MGTDKARPIDYLRAYISLIGESNDRFHLGFNLGLADDFIERSKFNIYKPAFTASGDRCWNDRILENLREYRAKIVGSSEEYVRTVPPEVRSVVSRFEPWSSRKGVDESLEEIDNFIDFVEHEKEYVRCIEKRSDWLNVDVNSIEPVQFWKAPLFWRNDFISFFCFYKFASPQENIQL